MERDRKYRQKYQTPISPAPTETTEGQPKAAAGLQKGIRNRSSLVAPSVPDYSHIMAEINAKHSNQSRDLGQMSVDQRKNSAVGAVFDYPDANKTYAGHNLPWSQFGKRFIDQTPGLLAPNGQLVVAGKAQDNSGKWGEIRWYVVSVDSVEDGTIAADLKNGFMVMRSKELPGGKKIKYWDTCDIDYQFGEVVECGRMPSGRTITAYDVDEHGNAIPKLQEVTFDKDGNMETLDKKVQGEVQLQPGYFTKQVTMAAPIPLLGGDRAIHYAKNAYGHYLNQDGKVIVWDKKEGKLALVDNPEIDPKTGLFPQDPEKNYFFNKDRYTGMGFRRIEYYTQAYVVDKVQNEFGNTKTKEEKSAIVKQRYNKKFEGRNLQSLTYRNGAYYLLDDIPNPEPLRVEYELQILRPGVEWDANSSAPKRFNVSEELGIEYEPKFGADDIWLGIQEKGRDPREIWIEPSQEGHWRGPKYRGELSGNSQEVFTFDAQSISANDPNCTDDLKKAIKYNRRGRIDGLVDNLEKPTGFIRGLVKLPYDIGEFKKGEKVFVSVEPDYVRPGNNEVVWINRVDFRIDEVTGKEIGEPRLRGFWSRPRNFSEVIVRESNGQEMPYHAQGRGQEVGGGQNGGPSALMHGMDLYGYIVSKTGGELVQKYARRGKEHTKDDPTIYDKPFLPGARHGASFNCPTFMHYTDTAHQFQQLLGWNTDDWMTVRIIMASCFANSLFCEAWERIQNGLLESTGLQYWGIKLGILSDKDSLGNFLTESRDLENPNNRAPVFSIFQGTNAGIAGAVTGAGVAAAFGAGLATLATGGIAGAVILSALSSAYYYSEIYDKSSRRKLLCNQEEIQKNPVEITDDDDPRKRYLARGGRVERPSDMYSGLESHTAAFEGLKNDLKWGWQNLAAHYFLHSNAWKGQNEVAVDLSREKAGTVMLGIFSALSAATYTGVGFNIGGLATAAVAATGLAAGTLTLGAAILTTTALTATAYMGVKTGISTVKLMLSRDGEDMARYYSEDQSEFVRNGYRKFFKDGRNYNNRFA